jgi:hypothetical protein
MRPDDAVTRMAALEAVAELRVYTRALLTDPAMTWTTSGAMSNELDTHCLQTQDRRRLFRRVQRQTRFMWTKERKAGNAFPYNTTIGQIAQSLRVSSEEVAEAILAWGYWMFFWREADKPVGDWRIDEDGE